MTAAPRPAWIEVDLGAIRRNVTRVGERLTPGTQTMAIVKANGYGHGAVEVARAALQAGATWLGVILVDEGAQLRRAGIDAPILLLHEAPADRLDEALGEELTPVVFTEAGIGALGEAAERAGRSVRAHLKIDTGLNRLGALWRLMDEIAAALAKEATIEVEALLTHFAFADQPRNPFIDTQLERFEEACERLLVHGIQPAFRHAANSAAAVTRPDAHYDLIRLGIAMYGLSPGPECDGIVALDPALTLRARVATVKRIRAGEAVSYGHTWHAERETIIASLPLGYGDGWARHLSNRTAVLIGGRRRPTIGTVCMDSFMADLGDDVCQVGDEAVLIGPQGDQRVTADEHAAAIGTINYEIVTRLAPRLPRIYLDG